MEVVMKINFLRHKYEMCNNFHSDFIQQKNLFRTSDGFESVKNIAITFYALSVSLASETPSFLPKIFLWVPLMFTLS